MKWRLYPTCFPPCLRFDARLFDVRKLPLLKRRARGLRVQKQVIIITLSTLIRSVRRGTLFQLTTGDHPTLSCSVLLAGLVIV